MAQLACGALGRRVKRNVDNVNLFKVQLVYGTFVLCVMGWEGGGVM